MILVIGATGFVGSAVVRSLRAAGLPVRALVRRQSASASRSLPVGVQVAGGDVLQPETLRAAMRGCYAVINLVGIIGETKTQTFEQMHVESVRNILAAMDHNGVQRLIHMSALGTRENGVSKYHKTKWKGEKLVRTSGLNWTIFRPSLIYGAHSAFLKQMLPLVRAPITPIISPGMDTGLLQPMHVDDVAACFAISVTDKSGKHARQIYDIGGPNQITTLQILQAMSRVLDRHLRPIRVPLALVYPVFVLGECLRLPIPVTPDQLQMLNEDTICDLGPLRFLFKIEPIEFETGLKDSLTDTVLAEKPDVA